MCLSAMREYSVINYEVNQKISVNEFVDVLRRSTLGERRPIDDKETMQGMIEHANLTVTAWHDGLLVGISRSVTDFHYACYLSDLAVDEAFQNHGIGKALIQLTADQLGKECKLLLVSAPAANGYYPKLGFEKIDRAWELPRGKKVGG